MTFARKAPRTATATPRYSATATVHRYGHGHGRPTPAPARRDSPKRKNVPPRATRRDVCDERTASASARAKNLRRARRRIRRPSRPALVRRPSRPTLVRRPSRPTLLRRPSRTTLVRRASRTALLRRPSRPALLRRTTGAPLLRRAAGTAAAGTCGPGDALLELLHAAAEILECIHDGLERASDHRLEVSGLVGGEVHHHLLDGLDDALRAGPADSPDATSRSCVLTSRCQNLPAFRKGIHVVWRRERRAAPKRSHHNGGSQPCQFNRCTR